MLSLVGSVLLVGAILGAGYYATLRHVWVSLSSKGVHGTGDLGRGLMIPWDESMVVEDSPILELEAFKRALAEVAPLTHPLANKVQNAI